MKKEDTNKEELALFVHKQIAEAGNYWKTMKVLFPYIKENSFWGESMIHIYMSLQQSFFITMFKIFDNNGKDAKERCIYKLINENIEDKKKLSKFKWLIEKIKKHRNKIYAHNTTEKWDMGIKEIIEIEKLLSCLAEICTHYSKSIYPNYHTRNVEILERNLKYIDELLLEQLNNSEIIITKEGVIK